MGENKPADLPDILGNELGCGETVTEDRRQMGDYRMQTEDGKQEVEDRRQIADDRVQTEDGRRETDDSGFAINE